MRRYPASYSKVHLVKVSNDPTSTTLTSPNPNLTERDNIVLVAQVSGTNLTGNVVFREGLIERGRISVDASGQATLTLPPGDAGMRQYTAEYQGDATHAPSLSAPVRFTIAIAPILVSITAPQPNTTVSWPASITIQANIDVPPKAKLKRIVFRANGIDIAQFNQLQTSYTWNIAVEGIYQITVYAEALDRFTESAPVTATVSNGSSLSPGDEIIFLHNDAAGSPMAATNWNGNVQWIEHYAPYGQRQLADPAAAGNRQWFHGKAQDDSGLQYFGARYYDPLIGRFMGVDAVGFNEGNIHSFNRYAYGNNNPLKYLDPDGNSASEVVTAAYDWVVGMPSRMWERFTDPSKRLPNGPENAAAAAAAMAGGMGAAASEGAAVGAKPDYSKIQNPPNVGPGKDFTLRQKQEALELNKKANDGIVRSDISGTPLVKPEKSQRGVTPNPNEWQFDHKTAKNCGGTNCSSNIQITSRKENRDKSDK